MMPSIGHPLSDYGPSLNALRRSAAKRGLTCTLTLQQYAELHALPECFYCCRRLPRRPIGRLLVLAKRTYGHGLDRMSNKVGYEWRNLVPCCNACNTSKGCHTAPLPFLRHMARFQCDEDAYDMMLGMSAAGLNKIAQGYRRASSLPPLYPWLSATI